MEDCTQKKTGTTTRQLGKATLVIYEDSIDTWLERSDAATLRRMEVAESGLPPAIDLGVAGAVIIGDEGELEFVSFEGTAPDITADQLDAIRKQYPHLR